MNDLTYTIAVEGMSFYAYHGYYQEERLLGNEFITDVYVETVVTNAKHSDDLGEAVNYEMIYQITKSVMKEKAKLLEYIANQIATKIKKQSANIQKVTVRISKKHPPFGGNVERTYVEMIYR